MIASHRVLRYAAPGLHLIALGDEHRAGRRRARSMRPAWRPARRAARRSRGAGASGKAAAARPLLRADERRAGRRAVGRPAPWHPGRLGSSGGHAMIRRAIDVVVASAVLVLASPLLAAAAIAIRLTSRGPRDLSPAPCRGRTGASSTCSSCARWSRGQSARARTRGRPRAIPGSPAWARSRRYSLDELPNL